MGEMKKHLENLVDLPTREEISKVIGAIVNEAVSNLKPKKSGQWWICV